MITAIDKIKQAFFKKTKKKKAEKQDIPTKNRKYIDKNKFV